MFESIYSFIVKYKRRYQSTCMQNNEWSHKQKYYDDKYVTEVYE